MIEFSILNGSICVYIFSLIKESIVLLDQIAGAMKITDQQDIFIHI